MHDGTLLLTLEEAGAELRQSADTVRRLIYTGRLKAVRLPTSRHALRVRRVDLETFIKNLPTTFERADALLRGRVS